MTSGKNPTTAVQCAKEKIQQDHVMAVKHDPRDNLYNVFDVHNAIERR